MPYNRINAIVGGKEKVVTSVDVYKEIRRTAWRVLQASVRRLNSSVFPAILLKNTGKAIPSPGTGRNTAEKLLS